MLADTSNKIVREKLYLIMTEWYDGDICTKLASENDRINISNGSLDHIMEQINSKTPDHFNFSNYSEDEIQEWIIANRTCDKLEINDAIQIGDTDTLDINQPDYHLNTLGGFSGTTYELWHEIKKKTKWETMSEKEQESFAFMTL